MAAYYNECDVYAAKWLTNLIYAGLIAPGDVDTRDIRDVKPSEIKGYTQCHFFAGIGGWSYALRLANWPDSKPVWSGSCPCQPFSQAGKVAGFNDPRHLWPSWYWLISQCNPAIIFGEQVAGAAVGPWIDLVQTDLEALDYAFGAVPFPAASVGAPHIRDRLYWAADTGSTGLQKRERVIVLSGGKAGADPGQATQRRSISAIGRVGDTTKQPRERIAGSIPSEKTQKHGERVAIDGGLSIRPEYAGAGMAPTGTACALNGLWADADWLFCRDGKWRPVEPGTFPLVNGATSRVGRLRAYGNAICAPAAVNFIKAYMAVI